MTCTAVQQSGFRYTEPVTTPLVPVPYSNLGYDPYMSNPMAGCSGFGGSIFNGFPGAGCMPGMGVAPGMGYMPGGIPTDPQSYMNQMLQYQEMNNEYQIRQAQLQRNQELQIEGPMLSIQQCVKNLHDKVQIGELDQIKEGFNALVEATRHAYDVDGRASEQDIKAMALNIYQQATGKSLEDEIRENNRGSFWQGLINGLTFGIFGDKSAEENIAEVTGQPEGEGSKIARKTGGALGGAGTGAAIGACCGGPVGALVGGAIGGIIGLFAG